MTMRICTSDEMRELDQQAEREYQISPELLMENAGRAAVTVIFDQYPAAGKDSEILVFAGKGNNGADGRVAARLLARRGVLQLTNRYSSPTSGALKLPQPAAACVADTMSL